MSRIATWRRGVGDPTTVRGWLVGGRREAPVPVDRKRILLFIGILAVFIVTAALLAFLTPHGSKILPLLHLVWPIYMMASNRKADKECSEPIQPDAPFNVTLSVYAQDGALTGRDRGQLIFSDGWILFEGERTSFSFTRGEARGQTTSTGLSFRLEDRRSVAFEPPHASLKETQHAYYVWNGMSIPDGEAILPPRETHPEVWASRFGLWLLGAFTLLVVAVLGVLYLPLVATVASVGAALCAIGARETARKLRDDLPAALPSRAEP